MSETSTSQDPVSYYIDHTIYTGRPADTTDRLPKEIRTYDLLDSLGITYTRADHDTLPTMEACQEVGKLLGIEICKNLFLRNTQKTALSADPSGQQKVQNSRSLQADRQRPSFLCRTGIYGTVP